jgi:hypothetical protein
MSRYFLSVLTKDGYKQFKVSKELYQYVIHLEVELYGDIIMEKLQLRWDKENIDKAPNFEN